MNNASTRREIGGWLMSWRVLGRELEKFMLGKAGRAFRLKAEPT